MPNPLEQCPDCGVFNSNGDAHICVVYDGPPCVQCGAPTVFVMIAAPGTGQGNQCVNGHYDGTCRELTLGEII